MLKAVELGYIEIVQMLQERGASMDAETGVSTDENVLMRTGMRLGLRIETKMKQIRNVFVCVRVSACVCVCVSACAWMRKQG